MLSLLFSINTKNIGEMKLLPFPRSYKILNEDAYKIFIKFKYCVMCAKEENNIQSIDPSVPGHLMVIAWFYTIPLKY